MRVLVVHESLWGNTRKVAEAVARALEPIATVDVVDTDSAPDVVEGYDLLIVGGPTHAFSMSRKSTREGARQQDADVHVPARGIREWLDDLTPVTVPIPSAAFDTRVNSPRLPGSAAKAARHELRSRGFDVAIKPVSFRVHGYQGPLVDGELERAAAWARGLVSGLAVPAL
ncbi:hypothetical protein QMG83_01430 [Salinibacterium sp. G-O1]|uniref:flavodoxin family protein n=1 Tax=Salinibacterium sp. G-O1 TaxID=3046208 RepID=UPI0024BAF1B1|nr:hypothetical protein [Salinibacterium sp. G-O1]MDJ0333879.1 hypothetical protein [Salinibacterium sp. G-O1]